MAKNSIDEVRLVQYSKMDEPIEGELPGLQLTDSTFTIAISEPENTYLEGTFGLTGDWVCLKFKLNLYLIILEKITN